MSLLVNSNTTDNTILGQAFMEQQEWLKAKEVAKILGTTDRTVARLVERGELAAYRVGRILKFRPTDVQEYLEKAKTVKTT